MSYSVEQLKSLLSAERGFASSNMYRVLLPSLQGRRKMDGTVISNYSPENINLLCKGSSLPGRQILTLDRQIGMTNTKVAYGYAVTELDLSFACTNSYLIRRYFEDWQQLAISNKSGIQSHAGYFDDYTQSIRVAQIRKPESFALTSVDLGFDLELPNIVKDQLPTIGGIDLGDLSEGRFDLAVVSQENIVYECELQNAFPTTLSNISFTNDADGISEFNVSLSYKNWFDVSPGTSDTISDTVIDLIEDGISIITSIFD